MKAGDKIVMAPSGVQKERIQKDELFILDLKGDIIHTPSAKPPPARPPKLSECAPLFMAAYEMRNAGAVLHSHSLSAVMATMLDPTASELVLTELEMIKGLEGHGFYDQLVVPIIENTARECELTDRLRQAIERYPKTSAVLVRRHGVYVWGRDWIQAKTQAECYDYLFEAAVRMRKLGIDFSAPAPRLPEPVGSGSKSTKVKASSDLSADGPPCQKIRICADGTSASSSLLEGVKAVVLDIEGTVAPISYVADVMFPYAAAKFADYVKLWTRDAEFYDAVKLIKQQAEEDAATVVAASAAASAFLLVPDFDHVFSRPTPGGVAAAPGRDEALEEAVTKAAVAWASAAAAADRKILPLKNLQGLVWRRGFESGELVSELFDDVPKALVEFGKRGLKTYIYSSGSREAQRLFFGYSKVGDLRGNLHGFFDTTSGSKVETQSYGEIRLSLGVDKPEQILFATDVLAEAEAAKAAGWRSVLVRRPGNKPIPGLVVPVEGPAPASVGEFRIVDRLDQLLA